MKKMRLDRRIIVPLVNEILDQYDYPLTIRQIYYRLMSHPYNYFTIKDDKYKGLDSILKVAREREEIDWHRIEDRHRHTIGGDEGWTNPDDFMGSFKEYIKSAWERYNKEIWASQDYKMELWIEKDAVSSLAAQVARDYKVLVFPNKGNTSLTTIMEAIEDRLIKYNDKRLIILHLGDHDPAGIDMTRDIKDRTERYGKKYGLAPICVDRIGLNMDQIKEFNLLTESIANPKDTRTPAYIEKFGTNKVWELDALPPDEMKKIITDAIEKYIDADKWNAKIAEIKAEGEEVKKRVSEMIDRLN